MNKKTEKIVNKMQIQGILTESIDDHDQEFHSFSPIQEAYGYPELKEIEDKE